MCSLDEFNYIKVTLSKKFCSISPGLGHTGKAHINISFFLAGFIFFALLLLLLFFYFVFCILCVTRCVTHNIYSVSHIIYFVALQFLVHSFYTYFSFSLFCFVQSKYQFLLHIFFLFFVLFRTI